MVAERFEEETPQSGTRPMALPNVLQILQSPYAAMARYARWLGVETAGTRDSALGRRLLAMRIAVALRCGTTLR
jgi:hypothetical protein